MLAESNWCLNYDDVLYFPPASLKWEYFTPSDTRTTGGWLGRASFYHVTVDGKVNRDAAWTYPAPVDSTDEVKDHVAFWKGIQVE